MIDLSSFIKVRCGTATEWLTSTYKLGKAELGFDETNRYLKVGDGKTLWANLPVLGGNLGVTSFGGKQGDILLGAGLTMSDNTLTLSTSGDNSVKYVSQTLTDEQKAQARMNIGAGTSSFDGDYKSLANKPTIPTKTSQLTNDSSFATTSQVEAKYTKPSGGIPKTDLATAVQNSLTSADNAVKYTNQSLTDAQKSQARTNIGAGTSNFSGNYNDLTDKLVIVQTIGTSTTSIMSQKATTDAVNGKQDKITSDNKLAASLISGLATVATSGSYTDLSSKPTKLSQFTNDSGFITASGAPVQSVNGKTGAVTITIPTVNNGTLTLKAGSTSKTFTANQSTNVTFEVTAASLGALTATKSIKTDNTTAQAVSASESTSGSGTINLHKVAKTGTYSDLIGVPTKLSQFTNDSGFTTNKGTVTQVKINGSTKSPDAAGLVDLGTISGTGTPGITPNISVTATELPAGSAPTATRSGTNENPLITFGIPQGRYFQTMGQFDLDPGGWVEETSISPYTHTQTVTVDLGQTVADNTPIIVSFDDVVTAVGVVLAQAVPSGTMVDLTFYALSVPPGNVMGNIGGVI